MDIIEELNDKQKEAVLAVDGPCLVIAGAGSGKTKVLTYKISYLMKEKNISSKYEIPKIKIIWNFFVPKLKESKTAPSKYTTYNQC